MAFLYGHEYGLVHVRLFDVELQTLYSNILRVSFSVLIQTDTYVDSGSGRGGCVLVKPGQSSVVTTSLLHTAYHPTGDHW